MFSMMPFKCTHILKTPLLFVFYFKMYTFSRKTKSKYDYYNQAH